MQSINNKVSDITVLAISTKVDFLCVVETWLSPNDNGHLSGYKMVARYCRERSANGAYHGGAGVLVKEDIAMECEPLNLNKFCYDSVLEVAAVKNAKRNLIVASVYTTTTNTQD